MSRGPFSATYNDGETAASTPIEVTLNPDAMVFRKQDSGAAYRWTYTGLTSVGPITASGGSQIGHVDHPGEIIFCDDAAFAQSILNQAPQLSQSAERRRVLVPILAIGAVIAAIAAAIWVFELSVSRTIAQQLPDELRKTIGEQVVLSLTKGKKACNQPEGAASLTKMISRLTTNTEATKNFDVAVAPLGIINAFAAPGEKIIISDALVRFVKSPEELAGIIAHEMGHGLELHPEAGIVRALGISAGLQLILGGNAGQLGEMGALLLQLRYTREGEREADEHAITILREAGIRPKPFGQFFSRLEERFGLKERKEKDTSDKPSESDNRDAKTDTSVTTDIPPDSKSQTFGNILEVFRTHPPLPERAKRIAELKPWPSTPVLSDGEWEALRKICN